MKIEKKFNNYDLYPTNDILGFDDQAWGCTEYVKRELSERIQKELEKKKKVVVCFDFYPGVYKEEVEELVRELYPNCTIDTETCAKTEEELNEEFYDFITNDRVFGIICHKKLDDFFDIVKMENVKSTLDEKEEGVFIIYGVGASLFTDPDVYVYCNMPRWEIQCRYRAGMPNFHSTNYNDPILTKYKRGFFVEWRLADRHKKVHYNDFDYVIDSKHKGKLKMITGDAFRAGIDKISREPFRMEPYFDPGVWGGHWMQTNFGLDPQKENFAWSFDGVPEENCINMRFGNVTVQMPAIDVVFYRPHELLGERVHGRFGSEFPIRFDLLDTMGGGNLSLQVHPLTEYIQDTFGMHYTQDESYYILDADEKGETFVYLGVQNDIDKEAFERDLRKSERGENQFPAENYVNRVPVKKHDHILIPAGTIHCSGKNTMVLEISATPYIFTFKLWDWGRVGLDGIPRPIHVEHGLKNIQWDRNTNWIYDNLVGQQTTLEKGEGYVVERTGLHNREFIDTHRYTVNGSYEVDMDDSVNMMNLVEGSHVFIESVDRSFERFILHYAETAIVPASVGKYRILSENNEEIKLVVASIRR